MTVARLTQEQQWLTAWQDRLLLVMNKAGYANIVLVHVRGEQNQIFTRQAI